MFMLFNAIVLVVTGLASAGAISADQARDERARSECADAGREGSATYVQCLEQRGVTVTR